MTPVCFLLTSVGRRVELVRHFMEYANQHPERLRVLGTEVDPAAPAAQALGDSLRILPLTSDAAYGKAVRALCEEEGVDAIFPLIDPDVSVLANTGLPVAGVLGAMAEVVSDKLLTYEWLLQLGVPTVDTWLPALSETEAFPVFMKPRRGSGAVDTFKVNNAEEYSFFGHYIPEPIAQRYLKGPEVTVDVVLGCNGTLLATVQRERLAVRGGEVTRGRVVYDARIEHAANMVVGGLQARGPVTVQGMYDLDGTFCVTEVNARMGGGIPLAIKSGVPLAALLVASWMGEHPTNVPQSDLAIGLHMARFDESIFWLP